MLFTRHYPGVLGGIMKVFDYVGHVRASGRFEPVLHLRPGSLDPRPFLPPDIRIVADPVGADAYFVAGLDWRVLDEAGIDTAERPVINLLQGFRHLDRRDALHAYFERRALRICVSEPLARAVLAEGRANGPVVAVPNGVDLDALAPFARASRERVFIAGLKNAALAFDVAELLRDADVDLCVERVSREVFLRRMAACAVTVALPFPFEGFYLPALEAMALGSAVVLSYACGPASYCIDGKNALVVAGDAAAIAAAVRLLLRDRKRRDALREAGLRTARQHSLFDERRAFLAALDRHVNVSA